MPEQRTSRRARPTAPDAAASEAPTYRDILASINTAAHAPRASAAGGVQAIDDLPLSDEVLSRVDRQQDIDLRCGYARALLVTLVAQLVIADVVFVCYAWFGRHWRLSTTVIDSWLGATLLEIVGIVVIVVKYLFPQRDPPAVG